MKKERLIWIVAIIVLILVILFLNKCKGKEVQENNIYKTIQDSTIYYRDKYNIEHARTSVIVASNINLLADIKTKDKTIIELQKLVKDSKSNIKDGGSVTIIHTTDTFNIVTKTFPINDSIFISNFKDKWLEYKIKATKDNTTLDFSMINQYNVIIGSKRPKWYKKKEPFVDISNLNPYDKIKSIRAFQVQDNTKDRFSIGLQIGYGVTKFGLSPYAGIGVQFKLFGL